MKITLQKLKISNFKGVKSLEVNFNQDKPTIISGQNKAGKTTIADAYYWILFGIDSNANKEFTIRPQSENGKPIDKVECTVEALITFDQNQIKLGKTHRQKWVKKRGEEKEEFVGNENVYFWNDVPLSEKEYKSRIEGLISEEHFKLISNFKYFQSLKWDEKRKKLYNLSEDVTNKVVFEKFPKIAYLADSLKSKSEDDFKKELKANISKIKKEIESTPDVINELQKQIVELPMGIIEQKAEIEKHIEARNSSRKIIEEQFKQSQEKEFELKKAINDLHNKIASKSKDFDLEKSNKLHDLQISLNAQKSKIAKYVSYLDSIAHFDSQLDALRKEYMSIHNEKFEFQQSKCNACGQDIKQDANEQQELFNLNKSKRLEEITKKANDVKAKKASIEVVEPVNDLLISAIEKQISELQASKFVSDDTIELAEIDSLNAQIAQIQKNELENANLIAIDSEKRTLKIQLDEINMQIASSNANQKIRDRIKELELNESKLGKEIAKLEKMEMDVQTLVNQKAKIFQDNINHLFKLAKVKMFELQVNGALNPTCIILDNGVAWNETNTANKTNIGIDIVNTFQKHFDIFAPVFIDDCEGINQLLETNGQSIQLHVTNNPLNIK